MMEVSNIRNFTSALVILCPLEPIRVLLIVKTVNRCKILKTEAL